MRLWSTESEQRCSHRANRHLNNIWKGYENEGSKVLSFLEVSYFRCGKYGGFKGAIAIELGDNPYNFRSSSGAGS